jgi:16S rRNA processing protein RimM
MRLEGVGSREAAEALRGEELTVEAAELPDLDEGHYYIHDLIGCRVLDPVGKDIGEVVGVVPGPQDRLEIAHRSGRSLVPMVREMLQQVDVEEGYIVIDLPEGLMEATRG